MRLTSSVASPIPFPPIALGGRAGGRPYSMTWSRSPGTGEDEGLAVGAPEAILALPLTPDAAADDWQRLVDQEASRGARLLLLARAIAPDQWSPVAVLAFADPLRPRGGGGLADSDAGRHPDDGRHGRSRGDRHDIARGAGSAVGRSSPELSSAPGLTIACVSNSASPSWPGRRPRTSCGSWIRPGRSVGPSPSLGTGSTTLPPCSTRMSPSPWAAARRWPGRLGSVLGDDAFPTLLFGLREGRRIVANVQKGLVFLVSTHVALLGFILIATIGGYDQPLLPIRSCGWSCSSTSRRPSRSSENRRSREPWSARRGHVTDPS